MRRADLVLNTILLAAILVLAYLVTTVGTKDEDALTALGIRPARRPGGWDELTTGTAARERKGSIGAEAGELGPGETVFLPANPLVAPESRFGGPESQGGRFVNLGSRNIFQTIIEKPPVPTTPAPTPAPPPPLQEVVVHWQLQAILGDMAFFNDPDTKEDIQIKVGREPYKRVVKNYTFLIEAVRIDNQKFEVELKSNQGKETVTIKMF